MAQALSPGKQISGIAHSAAMRIRLVIGIFAEEVIGSVVCVVAAICLMISGWQWHDSERIYAGAWLTGIGLTWLAPVLAASKHGIVAKELPLRGLKWQPLQNALRGRALSRCSRFFKNYQCSLAVNSPDATAAEAKPASCLLMRRSNAYLVSVIPRTRAVGHTEGTDDQLQHRCGELAAA